MNFRLSVKPVLADSEVGRIPLYTHSSWSKKRRLHVRTFKIWRALRRRLVLGLLCLCIVFTLVFTLASVSVRFRDLLKAKQMEQLGLPAEWAAEMPDWKINPAAFGQVRLRTQEEYEVLISQSEHPIALRYNILWGGLVWSKSGACFL